MVVSSLLSITACKPRNCCGTKLNPASLTILNRSEPSDWPMLAFCNPCPCHPVARTAGTPAPHPDTCIVLDPILMPNLPRSRNWRGLVELPLCVLVLRRSPPKPRQKKVRGQHYFEATPFPLPQSDEQNSLLIFLLLRIPPPTFSLESSSPSSYSEICLYNSKIPIPNHFTARRNCRHEAKDVLPRPQTTSHQFLLLTEYLEYRDSGTLLTPTVERYR